MEPPLPVTFDKCNGDAAMPLSRSVLLIGELVIAASSLAAAFLPQAATLHTSRGAYAKLARQVLHDATICDGHDSTDSAK